MPDAPERRTVDVLPTLPQHRHQGPRLAGRRGRQLDPPPAPVPGLREAVHHDGADAAHRAQAVRRDRGVQPRQGRRRRPQGLQGPAGHRARPGSAWARPSRTRCAGSGQAEFAAHDVGMAILGPLRELDEVAYLRFASVYKSFESAEDFEIEIAALRDAPAPSELQRARSTRSSDHLSRPERLTQTARYVVGKRRTGRTTPETAAGAVPLSVPPARIESEPQPGRAA